MKKLITIILILIATTAHADKLIIPFDCYPTEVQEKFLTEGIKLDLDGNERTQESWGFLKNEGNQFIIYTYNSITIEELDIVMEILNGSNNG